MKHSSILVVLLGFGLLAPLTCSKSKQPKERKEACEQPASPACGQNKTAFGAPLVKVATSQPHRG